MALPTLPTSYTTRKNIYEAALVNRRTKETDFREKWQKNANYFDRENLTARVKNGWESNSFFQHRLAQGILLHHQHVILCKCCKLNVIICFSVWMHCRQIMKKRQKPLIWRGDDWSWLSYWRGKRMSMKYVIVHSRSCLAHDSWLMTECVLLRRNWKIYQGMTRVGWKRWRRGARLWGVRGKRRGNDWLMRSCMSTGESTVLILDRWCAIEFYASGRPDGDFMHSTFEALQICTTSLDFNCCLSSAAWGTSASEACDWKMGRSDWRAWEGEYILE